MSNTLAIMFTMTTYGSWLRGDERGWVRDGRILPANPRLEAEDRKRMVHPPFEFDQAQLYDVGEMIGQSLIERLGIAMLGLTVQTWHTHFVVRRSEATVGEIAKCAKDAVRYGLRIGRPIWTAGYDKRFCFDAASVHARVAYVERHNLEVGLPARPWTFLRDADVQLL